MRSERSVCASEKSDGERNCRATPQVLWRRGITLVVGREVAGFRSGHVRVGKRDRPKNGAKR